MRRLQIFILTTFFINIIHKRMFMFCYSVGQFGSYILLIYCLNCDAGYTQEELLLYIYLFIEFLRVRCQKETTVQAKIEIYT